MIGSSSWRATFPPRFPHFARKILDRHTGAGADGLIVVMKPEVRGHDARIRFFNADGSEAEMSGNGIRCAGRFSSNASRRSARWKLKRSRA